MENYDIELPETTYVMTSNDSTSAQKPDSEEPPLGSGAVLSLRYRLKAEIGVGGMGRVFQAMDCETGSLCAVKVMHNHLKEDAVNRMRFEREAQVAINLKHENIVAVTDFGITESNEPFIVMEYLEGKSLAELLQEQRRLALTDFGNIFIRVCQGLSYAHKSNVVHRDMKPSNIMLIDGDPTQVKIVDFGIARVCKTTGEICPTSSAALRSLPTSADALSIGEADLLQHLTQPGEVFGSPLYMSPEQCQGEEADCRSEVYSLGCMMFESLTGVPPLKGKNAMETLIQRISYNAPSISSVIPNLSFPDELSQIVSRALERAPENRYQSVNEVLEAILVARCFRTEPKDINVSRQVLSDILSKIGWRRHPRS